MRRKVFNVLCIIAFIIILLPTLAVIALALYFLLAALCALIDHDVSWTLGFAGWASPFIAISIPGILIEVFIIRELKTHKVLYPKFDKWVTQAFDASIH